MKKKEFALGILCGAMLFSGASAVAAGITAEPTWQNIYVDGEQASMTAYNWSSQEKLDKKIRFFKHFGFQIALD